MICLPNLSEQQSADLLPENIILLGYRGSIAHNMYIPSTDPDSIDDKDIMGVFVGPVEHYLGFGSNDVKEKFIGEWDAVSYEVGKFIRLLLKCNPNVLSLLWLSDQHLFYEQPLGARLRANKQIFVTSAAYHSFIGYAQGQLRRMTHFNQEVRQTSGAPRLSAER
jgi:predicted nucleotidyltransferase